MNGSTLGRASKWFIALLCPALLAPFTALSLYAQNQIEVERSLLTQPVLVAMTAAVAVFGGVFLVTRSRTKASVLSSIVVVGFFDYGIYFGARSAWFLVLWLALLTAAIAVVLRTRRDLENLLYILAAAGLVMTVPQGFKIVRYDADHPSISASDERLWPTALATPVAAKDKVLPDIYVLIPDDYARADVLKRYFQYDNSRFVHALERRGFVFSNDGRSPYSDSESNVASALNMDYLTRFGDVLGKTSDDVRIVKRVSEDSRASRMLTSIGYDYVHLDTDEVSFAGGNPGISPFAAPDSFANLWLNKSVLGAVGGRVGFNDPAMGARFRHGVRSGFDELRSVRTGSKPKFVVFHTLIPHDPYVVDAEGRPITYDTSTDVAKSNFAGRAHYLQQLEFTSTELLKTIDQILASSKTPPVIVLQSDEGFEVEPDVWGEKQAEDIRVKGVMAFHFPGLDRSEIPTPPNTVNTLRFVFNHYVGTHYPMLDTASYADGDLPYDFQEIKVR